MHEEYEGYVDPIVDEIRRYREAYAASLGYDGHLIAVDMERRGMEIEAAMARMDQDPNALDDLLTSKRWNGGLGLLGPPEDESPPTPTPSPDR